MYTRYFGFNEKPFTLTPNPRFLFLSRQHKEAFAHILYGINHHHGFIELTGEVGTGKTTVLRTLLGQLQDGNYRFALIFNPCMTAVELLRNINQEYGIATGGSGINDLLNRLNGFLLEENREGRTVVLVIDEAQNLQPEVLEQLRLISNLETDNDKLIQIVLAGQPELENLLQRHSLRQLNQRIAVRYRLGSMGREETGAYIRHRLEIAGAVAGVSFSNLATSLIHLYSHGVPRMINIVCDRALLTAYGDGRRRVTFSTVLRAMNELGNPAWRRSRSVRLGVLLLIPLVTLVMLSNGNRLQGVFLAGQQRLRESLSRQPAGRAVQSPKTVPPFPDTRLEQALSAQGLTTTHIGAFNGLMARWNARPIRMFRGTLSVPVTFESLAAKRNLRCTVFKGALDDAIRFNLPFLASTRVVDNGKGHYCLAVTSVRGEQLSVSPPLLGRGEIRKSDLAHMTDGTFYLLWRDSTRIRDGIEPGESREKVRTLQQLLKQAGFFRQAIDGGYNSTTIKAVREFQHSLGIPVNDSGGELTLALLSRHDGAHASPSLTGN